MSEIALSPEIVEPAETDRVYGILKPESELNRTILNWQQHLEAGDHLPDSSVWSDETTAEIAHKSPRNLILTEVDPEAADAATLFLYAPVSPFSLHTAGHDGALIAAGIPTNRIMYNDNPGTLSDDAFRTLLKQAYDWNDPEHQKAETKLRSFVYEHGAERGMTAVSSAASFFLLAHPELLVPLLPIKLVGMYANGKSWLNSPQFDRLLGRLGPHIPVFRRLLEDPDRFADFKHAIKPLLAQNGDTELEDSVVSLETEDIFAHLREQGLNGKTVTLVDDSHSSGENVWKNEQKRGEILKKQIEKMVRIRTELGKLHGEVLTSAGQERFLDEVSRYLGTVSLYRVREEPQDLTPGTIAARMPLADTFVSQRVSSVVHALGQKAFDQAYFTDSFPPSVNDF